jgi:hypothetical protein
MKWNQISQDRIQEQANVITLKSSVFHKKQIHRLPADRLHAVSADCQNNGLMLNVLRVAYQPFEDETRLNNI